MFSRQLQSTHQPPSFSLSLSNKFFKVPWWKTSSDIQRLLLMGSFEHPRFWRNSGFELAKIGLSPPHVLPLLAMQGFLFLFLFLFFETGSCEAQDVFPLNTLYLWRKMTLNFWCCLSLHSSAKGKCILPYPGLSVIRKTKRKLIIENGIHMRMKMRGT